MKATYAEIKVISRTGGMKMGINEIAADYYQAGYTNNKATKAEEGKSFAEISSQKVVEADKQYCLDRASAAFDTIGAHAPDEVR